MNGASDTGQASARERVTDGIDLWLAPTDLARDEDAAHRYRELLTPEERDSCQAFHHEVDRRRALLTRALVRTTLSRYAPVDPQAWRFEREEHERPVIAAPTGTRLCFNLSHTRELVACAVTLDAHIGVDIEREEQHPDLADLAREVFSAPELLAFRKLGEPERRERFYAIWTLKESYLKARGLGLGLSPRSLEFDLDTPGCVRARFAADARDDPSHWWFARMRADAVHPLALAARRSSAPARVSVFDVTSSAQGVARGRPAFLAVSCGGLA